MPGDREIKLVFRIDDEGTISVLDKAGAKLRQFEDVATKSAAGASQGFTALKGVLAGIGVGVGFAGIVTGLKQIKDFAADSVSASIEQQTALKLLDAQLHTSGQFSTRYSSLLAAQASALQRVTTVGDETITGLQRQLVAFGATEDNIQRVTEATLDFAAGTGRDAQTAVLLFGKALTGQFGTLRRFGIEVDKNASDADKLEQALSGVEARFGGQAVAAANTFGGAIQQASGAFGELQESIGNIITDSPAVVDLLHDARDSLFGAAEGTAKWVTENRGLIDQKIGEYFNDAVTVAGLLKAALVGVADGFGLIGRAADEAGKALGTAITDTTVSDFLSAAGVPVEVQQRLATIAPFGIAATPLRTRRGINARREEIDALAADQRRFASEGQFSSFDPFADPFVQPSATRQVGKVTAIATATRASADAAKEQAAAEKDILQSVEAITILRESDLSTAEALLANAQDIGASQQEQLALAQQVDAAELAVLDAQIGVLGAKIEAVGVAGGELDLLLAQVDALGAQRDLITQTGGEAAKVTREFEEQRKKLIETKQVTLDLGRELNTSIQRAVDGLLQGNGGGIDDILKGTGTALASSFIGGLLEAELAKNSFDAKVSENFSVTLPGFMQTGADAITNIWGSAMDFLSGSTDSATRGIGTSFAGLGSQLQGLSRNTGGGIGGFSSVFNFGAAANAAQAAGGTVVPGIGVLNGADVAAGQQAGILGGAGGGGLGALGAVGGIAALAVIAVQTIEKVSDAVAKERKRFGTSAADVRAQAFLELPLLNILGKFADKIGVLDDLFKNPVVANLIAPGFRFFQAPSPTQQAKTVLSKLLEEGGVPKQRIFQAGGDRGVRANLLSFPLTEEEAARLVDAGFNPRDVDDPLERRIGRRGSPGNRTSFGDLLDFGVAGTFGFPFGGLFGGRGGPSADQRDAARLQDIIDKRSQPGVSELRTGPVLGLFDAATLDAGFTDTQLLANVNAFTTNLQLLGVTEDEARRQTLKFAESLNINLLGGIDAVNSKFLQLEKRTENDSKRAIASVTGLIDLFSEDLPAGVDIAAIAMKNFSETSGFEVGKIEKEVNRLIEIYGKLANASNSGLGTGLADAGQAIAARNQAYEDYVGGSGSLLDVLNAGNVVRPTLISPLIDSIRDGMTTAITEGVFDAVKDSAPWKALQEQIADVVKGGDIGSIAGLVGDVVNASLGELEAAAQTIQAINAQFGATPTALFASADQIDANIESNQFGRLSRRNQESQLRRELGDIGTEIAALTGDSIDDALQSTQLAELYRKQATLGFQLGDVASQRFADGSRQQEIASRQGEAFAEAAATGLRALGFDVSDNFSAEPTVANTSATEQNTAALEKVAQAITQGIGTGTIAVTIDGADGGIDGQQLAGMIFAQMKLYLQSPEGQAIVRDTVNHQ